MANHKHSHIRLKNFQNAAKELLTYIKEAEMLKESFIKDLQFYTNELQETYDEAPIHNHTPLDDDDDDDDEIQVEPTLSDTLKRIREENKK